jgi:hypothetical protein
VDLNRSELSGIARRWAEAKTSLGQSCRTPCQLAVQPDSDFSVTLALSGYQPHTVSIRPEAEGASAASRLAPNPIHVTLQAVKPPKKPVAKKKRPVGQQPVPQRCGRWLRQRQRLRPLLRRAPQHRLKRRHPRRAIPGRHDNFRRSLAGTYRGAFFTRARACNCTRAFATARLNSETVLVNAARARPCSIRGVIMSE